MKTRSKRATLFAAAALGAAILVGSALPSLAQTSTPQPQATVQTGQPSAAAPGGWYGPMIWWAASSNATGTAIATSQLPTSRPVTGWGCWGGWW